MIPAEKKKSDWDKKGKSTDPAEQKRSWCGDNMEEERWKENRDFYWREKVTKDKDQTWGRRWKTGKKRWKYVSLLVGEDTAHGAVVTFDQNKTNTLIIRHNLTCSKFWL